MVSAFDRFPELHFDAQLQVGAGSSSVYVVYRSVRDLLALADIMRHPHLSPITQVSALAVAGVLAARRWNMSKVIRQMARGGDCVVCGVHGFTEAADGPGQGTTG